MRSSLRCTCRLGTIWLATIALVGSWTAAKAQADRRSADKTVIQRLTRAESSDARATVPPRQTAADHRFEWCQTQVRWAAKMRAGGQSAASGLCPTQGPCDIPSTRDTWIPGGGEQPITIRVKFNIFANDDGSDPAATEYDANAQLGQLNQDYLPSHIQFVATTEIINDSAFRQYTYADEFLMKSVYADDPAHQLNIYVTTVLEQFYGVGYWPWDTDATGIMGGVIVDDLYFGPGQSVLAHEIGHCLGLWHTQHGVTEVPECGDCYERADGVDGDETGDFASDTAPTPINFTCDPPGGTDPCSGVPWGETDLHNFMGYAPQWCWGEFSQHQWGRMHCWIDAVLAGWLGEPVGACCHGATCTVESQSSCLAGAGVYLGDFAECRTAAGAPVLHQATVNLPIPDGGGPGNPVSHTINLPESLVIGDVNVGLEVTHPWVGHLAASLSHGGTTVTLVNQPEIHGSSYTCTADNYDIVLDDEGTGSGIQGHCQDDLSSPPNYAPKQALAAFDGMDAAGDWVITVYDDVSGNAGTLNAWSLEIDEMGPGPCGIPCEFDYECDDGAYCNGSEICSPLGKCEAGSDPCAGTATPQCDEEYDVCRECLGVEHCSDDNDCTSDICVDFICVNDLLPDGTPCAGGLGSCESGECIGRPCEGPADCDDGDWCSIDECIDNECLNTPRVYGDTDLSGVVNVFDIFCILDGIAGDFGTCAFENDDIEPCGGNGTLNLFDAFAALNAITGDDPCCGG